MALTIIIIKSDGQILLYFFRGCKNLACKWGKRPGGKVIFLTDNCGEHGGAYSIPSLFNFTVYFLPPSTAQNIQPVDAGKIASVTPRHRSFHIKFAVDLSDGDVSNI